MWIANGNNLSVAHIGAKRVEVPIPEGAVAIVEHGKRLDLVCFHGANRLQQHSLGFISAAVLALLRECCC
jgi:hypothetical protein